MDTMNLQKKIIDSLHIIRNECKKNLFCQTCVFYGGRCEIRKTSPDNWNINNDIPEWKALI